MTDAIDVYLHTILTPQLEQMGVRSFPGAIEAVVADIRCRLQSVLACWHIMPAWNTLLLLGREEGAFYELRSASLEIRAFVVTVRNSLLEDLGIAAVSLIPASVAASEKPMQEANVQPIIEAAIRYWQTIDLQGLRVPLPVQKTIPLGISARALLMPGTFSLPWQMRESIPSPILPVRHLASFCPMQRLSTIRKNAAWSSAELLRSLTPLWSPCYELFATGSSSICTAIHENG